MSKKFFYALSTLIGMIVGVGIFGIPYVSAQAGFSVGLFYLVILTFALILVHLCYGEIILRTSNNHSLVGCASHYFGKAGKRLISAILIFEFYGAMLAYIIAGGKFLHIALSPFLGLNEFSWTFIFFVFGSLIILTGLKTIAPSELFMAVFMIFIIGVLVAKGVPLMRTENLIAPNWVNFFLPYGVIFFSLTGGAAIPGIRQILKGSEQKIKKVIIWGTLLPAIIYAFFMLSVLGVSGSKTSQDAISGLVPYFGQWVILAGAIFGFLAVITSFLIIGNHLKEIFHFEYKINKFLSWGFVCFIPLAAYLFGVNNFIFVIGLIGAVAGGMEGIIIVLLYWRAKKKGDRQPEYSLKLHKRFFWALIALFALGIVYEFLYLVK